MGRKKMCGLIYLVLVLLIVNVAHADEGIVPYYVYTGITV